jgi:hypothetical protein
MNENKYLDLLTGLNDAEIKIILDLYKSNKISFKELIDMINPVIHNVDSYRVFDKSIKMDMMFEDEITERFLDDDIHD